MARCSSRAAAAAAASTTTAPPVFQAELWDPATNRWTQLASQTVYRGYHSTALLLPDGRVLSAGGRHERTAEVFSPPYLFKGARPTISSAPAVVTPGTTFSSGRRTRPR